MTELKLLKAELNRLEWGVNHRPKGDGRPREVLRGLLERPIHESEFHAIYDERTLKGARSFLLNIGIALTIRKENEYYKLVKREPRGTKGIKRGKYKKWKP